MFLVLLYGQGLINVINFDLSLNSNIKNQSKKPLSIVIPTYNRSKSLKDLLQTISRFNKNTLKYLEICISDNNSSDKTDQVIKKFLKKRITKTKHIKQSKNIGSSLNILAVSKIATSPYILILGDDDQIIEQNLIELIKHIKNTKNRHWIILNTVSGINNYKFSSTHNFKNKTLNNFFSKTFFLIKGTKKIGFIGTHVLPAQALKPILIKDCNLKSYIGWPHIKILTDFLSNTKNKITFFYNPVVINSANAQPNQFWRPSQFFFIQLSKYFMILNQKSKISAFNILMCLRDLYSATTLGLLISWKVFDEKSFKNQFSEKFKNFLESTSFFFKIICQPWFLINKILIQIPNKLILICIPKKNLQKLKKIHSLAKQNLKALDGVLRGL